MPRNLRSFNFKRSWPALVLAGAVAFALSFGVLAVFTSGATTALRGVSDIVLTTILCAIVAHSAMSVTGALLARQTRLENSRMRTAID
ncbi:MAG: hypothetical protein ACRECA_05815, partial [Pseudolabrys sp.]